MNCKEQGRMGHVVAQLFEALRYKGSIPDGILGIFHPHNPSGLTGSLGSTQPLTEMITTDIQWGRGWWGKCDRCLGMTNLSPSCSDCYEI